MGDTSKDPVDHARTTRPHAGESMKNGSNAPGLVAMAVGIVALVVGLFLAGTGHVAFGAVGIAVAVLLLAGGGAWLARTHRQVQQQERRWLADHPEARTT